ncbi:uncharacterized protein LAESUDRAFT_618097, partial [Laetiporus sulphureus 93-53]
FLQHEKWLCSMLGDVQELPFLDDPRYQQQRDVLESRIRSEINLLQDRRLRDWCKQTPPTADHSAPQAEHYHWMARLLSRPGMEDIMSSANRHAETVPKEKQRDIWDAPLFQNFKGPDGISSFAHGPSHESRYLFSLSIDGFNPFYTKVAKQNVSVTGIYMVCLNLPPHLRYLPENTYLVGIIP